jgi:hypothetical protein
MRLLKYYALAKAAWGEKLLIKALFRISFVKD